MSKFIREIHKEFEFILKNQDYIKEKYYTRRKDEEFLTELFLINDGIKKNTVIKLNNTIKDKLFDSSYNLNDEDKSSFKDILKTTFKLMNFNEFEEKTLESWENYMKNLFLFVKELELNNLKINNFNQISNLFNKLEKVKLNKKITVEITNTTSTGETTKTVSPYQERNRNNNFTKRKEFISDDLKKIKDKLIERKELELNNTIKNNISNNMSSKTMDTSSINYSSKIF